MVEFSSHVLPLPVDGHALSAFGIRSNPAKVGKRVVSSRFWVFALTVSGISTVANMPGTGVSCAFDLLESSNRAQLGVLWMETDILWSPRNFLWMNLVVVVVREPVSGRKPVAPSGASIDE